VFGEKFSLSFGTNTSQGLPFVIFKINPDWLRLILLIKLLNLLFTDYWQAWLLAHLVINFLFLFFKLL